MSRTVINTRPKSPPRSEVMTKALRPVSLYSNRVLIGNWVESRTDCPKRGIFYFPPKDEIDYDKWKPESRKADFRLNKINGLQANVVSILRHDCPDTSNNFVTTNDLVYNHLPEPYCGPIQRYYRRSQAIYYPQPDLTKYFSNVTEWGLKKYKEHEWACTDVSDYIASLYDDTYVRPARHQYLQSGERKPRDSSFTKSFQFKMTKPLTKPKKK